MSVSDLTDGPWGQTGAHCPTRTLHLGAWIPDAQLRHDRLPDEAQGWRAHQPQKQPSTVAAAAAIRSAPSTGRRATSTPVISAPVTPRSRAVSHADRIGPRESPAATRAARRTSAWVLTSNPDRSMLPATGPRAGASTSGSPAAAPASHVCHPAAGPQPLPTQGPPGTAGDRITSAPSSLMLTI